MTAPWNGCCLSVGTLYLTNISENLDHCHQRDQSELNCHRLLGSHAIDDHDIRHQILTQDPALLWCDQSLIPTDPVGWGCLPLFVSVNIYLGNDGFEVFEWYGQALFIADQTELFVSVSGAYPSTTTLASHQHRHHFSALMFFPMSSDGLSWWSWTCHAIIYADYTKNSSHTVGICPTGLEFNPEHERRGQGSEYDGWQQDQPPIGPNDAMPMLEPVGPLAFKPMCHPTSHAFESVHKP